MNSKEFFNQFYQTTKDHYYSQSLFTFFNQIVFSKLPQRELKILDIGSGSYSLFEDCTGLNAHVDAIDFSKTAISNTPISKINYKLLDITDAHHFNFPFYDLIFDSHCLNCITSEDDRENAFKNIYSALVVGGIFASEIMIQPIGEHVSMPFKSIKSAQEIEQTFVSHGFKIIYFMISSESGFSNSIGGIEVKCDLLRIIAKK